MKKTTETHFWHLNQVEKIKYDQSMVKVSHNLLQVKATKRLYNYRPIRSSVADIQEAINRESDLFALLDNKEKNRKMLIKITMKTLQKRRLK
jgi:cytochrome c biogenesis factor